jgi:hypothetical protein
MEIIGAIRFAEATVTVNEAARAVFEAEARAIGVMAGRSGLSDAQISDAFKRTGHSAHSPIVLARRPLIADGASRLQALRESLECTEDFPRAVRSATRVRSTQLVQHRQVRKTWRCLLV